MEVTAGKLNEALCKITGGEIHKFMIEKAREMYWKEWGVEYAFTEDDFINGEISARFTSPSKGELLIVTERDNDMIYADRLGEETPVIIYINKETGHSRKLVVSMEVIRNKEHHEDLLKDINGLRK